MSPSAARPARISAAMASATWRKTGKGVAQSLCNLVRIGDAATARLLDDLTVVIPTLGRGAPLADLAEWNDRTAGGPAVIDIIKFLGEIRKCVREGCEF